MSTYYYLVCDAHRVRCPLVSLRSSDGFMMAHAHELLPSFINVHDSHHRCLRVAQEEESGVLEYREHTAGEHLPDDDKADPS
jgi:hypothetical protein